MDERSAASRHLSRVLFATRIAGTVEVPSTLSSPLPDSVPAERLSLSCRLSMFRDQPACSARSSQASCSAPGRDATSAWCWKLSPARLLAMVNLRAIQA